MRAVAGGLGEVGLGDQKIMEEVIDQSCLVRSLILDRTARGSDRGNSRSESGDDDATHRERAKKSCGGCAEVAVHRAFLRGLCSHQSGGA